MNPVPFILLAISLPLLLGSVCHAGLRTWTAVNGKEVEAEFVSNEKGIVKLKLNSGKVFEVPADKLSKEDNEFISSLTKPEGVKEEELKVRGGIAYLKGSDTPYTGKSFELNGNGQKKAEANFKDGKLDGLWVWRYGNGQKEAEANFKDGKKDGLAFGWYADGKKKFETSYKDDKLDGLGVEWYRNGQKIEEVNFKDGKRDGLWTVWYENGQKAREVNYKDGKKISGKYWNNKGEPFDSLDEALKNNP